MTKMSHAEDYVMPRGRHVGQREKIAYLEPRVDMYGNKFSGGKNRCFRSLGNQNGRHVIDAYTFTSPPKSFDAERVLVSFAAVFQDVKHCDIPKAAAKETK